ncbi:MAG: transcription termination factor NusA [Candidatus Falkowbacteria bacterium]
MKVFDGKTIQAAIKQICAEKGLDEAMVVETLEAALAAAYRKDFAEKNQNPRAILNIKTGELEVFDEKTVVENLTEEEISQIEHFKELRQKAKEEGRELTEQEMPTEEMRKFSPRMEIELKDAKLIEKKIKVGEVLKTVLEIPGDFGRMAAQTAKQVITQRLREAERNIIYQAYKEKEKTIVNGIVQRREGFNTLVDLDRKATAILPQTEQIRGENYRVGARFKFYIVNVNLTTRGPEIVVSRSHPEIVRELFATEIPEVADKTIEIKGIAREAGMRSKVAIWTGEANLDPIGSCIGQRGSRIQTIIHELNGEKVDVILYSEKPVQYIKNALSPAKINNVELDEDNRVATVTVNEDQLSLTIGRSGQNVRLASKLTGWMINIKVAESGKEVSSEEVEKEGI